MARFNPAYWEIPTDTVNLDRVPATSALWFETESDQDRRHAVRKFFRKVTPAVNALVDAKLTRRQKEVVALYYYHGKSQEDIAVILDLTQSTISRHLFGTVRDGKKVGGAIPKLRKALDKDTDPVIEEALTMLRTRLARAD